MLPALSQVVEAEAKMNMRFELQRLGFAIVAFKADKNKLPSELSELVPNYLPELPVDQYAGDTMRFVTDGEQYLAYSIGPNRVDDGGATRNSVGRADDIAIGELNVLPESTD